MHKGCCRVLIGVLGSLALSAWAQAPDVNGVWALADNPRFRVQAVQRGSDVTMTYLQDECQGHTEESPGSCSNIMRDPAFEGSYEDNFHKGDVFLAGHFSESGQLEGRSRFYIHRQKSVVPTWRRWRELCGNDYQYMANVRLRLSPDGASLSGEYYKVGRDSKTCQLSADSGWRKYGGLVRVVTPPPVIARNDDWWKSPEDKTAANAKPALKPVPVVDKSKVAAVPKPAEPKQARLPPVELPKVETSPPAPPAPEPVVPPLEPASGKNLAMGAGLLALLSAVFFFIRNAYVNYLVGSLKRSPNDANLAGWALFGGFLFASAMGSLALANSEWLTGQVMGVLGGLSAACFGLCAMTSRKN